jgi:hypothetical protein
MTLEAVDCESFKSGAQGRACPYFRAAPLPAPCNRHSERFCNELEAKHDSGRHTEIVLALSVVVVQLIETREQVIDFRRA